jgi:DNA-binding NarL/FixJ family response regulator
VLVQARTIRAKAPLSDLTPREREVLAQLAQGKSNGAIAHSLVLSKRAVKNHINAIFMKLDLATPTMSAAA